MNWRNTFEKSIPGHNQDDSKLRPELAKPIQNKIFIAGEATSVLEYALLMVL
jgi:hypothetical protein